MNVWEKNTRLTPYDFKGKNYKACENILGFPMWIKIKQTQGLHFLILRKNFNAYPLWMFGNKIRISHVNLFCQKTIRFTPCDFKKKLMLTPCECLENKLGFSMWIKKKHKVYPLWFWEKLFKAYPLWFWEKL